MTYLHHHHWESTTTYCKTECQRPDRAICPHKLADEPFGYIVLTKVNWSQAGLAEFQDDWDGVVHATYDLGVQALVECRNAGYDCQLAELVAHA